MRRILGVIAITCWGLVAKPVHAPLPSEVYKAKTIAIVNHTNHQSAADKAYAELQKWGRFIVVTDPGKADIVLVIGVESHPVGATARTYGGVTRVTQTQATDVTTAFFLAGQQEPFFSEAERASLIGKSATKRCVDDFRKRLEEDNAPRP